MSSNKLLYTFIEGLKVKNEGPKVKKLKNITHHKMSPLP